MLARFARSAVIASAALVCLSASYAHADPVTVTGGGLFLYWDGGPTGGVLTGPGFSIAGDGTGGSAAGWEIGTLGTLSGSFSYNQFFQPSGVTINESSYPAFLAGNLTFSGEPFLVQAGDGVFTTNFTLAGKVRGFDNPERSGMPLFDFDLTGRGVASTAAFPVPGTDIFLNRTGVTYVFGEPLSATPEPGTWLLLATGLAGLGLFVRRKAQPTAAPSRDYRSGFAAPRRALPPSRRR